jgi:hypothetical protein
MVEVHHNRRIRPWHFFIISEQWGKENISGLRSSKSGAAEASKVALAERETITYLMSHVVKRSSVF